MAITLRATTDNLCKFYFVHTISGINRIILGCNFINAYIDENPTKYNLYLECEEEIKVLNEHKDLKHILDGNETVIYVFEVPDKYKTEYRKFRENRVDDFADWFIEDIFKNSGWEYKMKNNKGVNNRTNKNLLRLDKKDKGYYIATMLDDIHSYGIYEEFDEIPFINSAYGITTWAQFDKLLSSVRAGKVSPKEMEKLLTSDYKLTEVIAEEFIENYNWG